VEDGDLAVRIGMDADLGAHEMRPGGMRRNLQAPAVPGDRVVGRDDALLMDAENVAPLRLCYGNEGALRLGRRGGEAGVVGGQIDLAADRPGE
jgi:hypothetical protein